jgi:hypothetical protein
MSKLILNFGHPITGHALEGIRDEIGSNLISLVRLELAPNAPVGEQVFKACRRAVELYGKPDYLILPTNPVAAAYVSRFFTTIEGFPPCVTYTPIIRLAPLAAPDAFAFGGIEE